jgi:DnaK suppressor protein
MKRKVPKRPAKPAAAKKVTRPKATARDILGAPLQSQEIVPSKWRKHFNRLIKIREQLRGQKELLTRDVHEEQPAFSLHMADAGTDNFDRDLALSMLSSEQNALYEIEQALDRIRKGTYGICEMTGKKIGAERLEAIPWTRFSMEAERELESNGQVGRARLAGRERIPRTAVQEPSEEED